MADFVTILTVAYPQQLWIIKGKLESEGIECFAKDELTVQSNNLWSNAVGGVKLQVQQQDVERAIGLLTELGYIKVELNPPEDLLTRIDRKTDSIPLLKNLKVKNRIVAITLISIFLITSTIYFVIKPTKFDLLNHGPWIVDKIYYKGKIIGPKTIGIINVPGRGNVDLSQFGGLAVFSDDNTLFLPGLNSGMIDGTWKKDGGQVVLNMDTLGDKLNGSYNLEMSENEFTLKSVNTTIVAHRGP